MKSKQKPVEVMSAKDFKKSVSSEKNVYTKLAQWLKSEHRSLIYRFDLSADTKLTIGQSVRQKTLQMEKRGFPDLTIFKACGPYHGLCLEIKREGAWIYQKRDPQKPLDAHVAEQMEMIERLQAQGYKVGFVFGFDHARDVIVNYLNRIEKPFNK